jgi:uncharacterized membrane protein
VYSSAIYLLKDILAFLLNNWCWVIIVMIVCSLGIGLWLMLHAKEYSEVNKAEERLRANKKSADEINQKLAAVRKGSKI